MIKALLFTLLVAAAFSGTVEGHKWSLFHKKSSKHSRVSPASSASRPAKSAKGSKVASGPAYGGKGPAPKAATTTVTTKVTTTTAPVAGVTTTPGAPLPTTKPAPLPTAKPAPLPTTKPAVVDEVAPATIAAALERQPDLSGLLGAAVAAGGIVLEGAIDNSTVATVFAPTNEAFAAALEALKLTPEELAANTDLLTKILSYHIVSGAAVAAADIKSGTAVGTLLSPDAKLTLFVNSAGGVKVQGDVNNANVVKADVQAGKSIIHVIDAVLVPAGSFLEASPVNTTANTTEAATTVTTKLPDVAADAAAVTIASTASAAPQLSTLLAAVKASSLLEAATNADTDVTVFAPTDEAFAAALKGLGLSAEEVLGNKALVDTILSYHVVAGKTESSAITSGAVVPTLLDTTGKKANLTLLVNDGKVVVVGAANNATVVTADVPAGKSVVHVIDTVLIPPIEFVEKALVA